MIRVENVKFLTDMDLVMQHNNVSFVEISNATFETGESMVMDVKVNGKKCNSAKFCVCHGAFFDNSKISIQSVLRL